MTTHRSSALRTPPARERRTLLDLCSRLDLDDGAFLAEAASWWQRVCPAGPLGSIAVAMWRGGDGRVGIDPARHGSSEALAAHRAVFVAAGESVMTALIDTAPRFGSAGSIPDVDGALAISRGFGLCDFVGVLAPTGTGHLLVVGSPVERPAVVSAAPDPAAQACASHLAAAWRLRRRLQAGGARDDHAEAVALPDGRVVHAVGEAGEPGALATIRRMVLARERGRSGPRVDAEPLWPELVAGRWTLADSFDHDGRRYVVAYRNPPDAPRRRIAPRAREVLARTARGEATKVIAAELGVRESAVSMALHAAMAGLRIGSVGELIRLAAGADPETVFRDDGLWASVLAPPAGVAPGALTGAEREVLDELLRGATNGQIAARRSRSARTVANQIASVFAKLRVDSRRGLLAKLARR